jgi:hypothetical protein
MRIKLRNVGGLLALLSGMLLLSGGCRPGDQPAKKDGDGKPKPVAAAKDRGAKGGKQEPKHDEWWCAEHGIPEEECSMCSAKVEKECKARGDWCDKHNRALSQCFICNPRRKEFYAAKYRAKYGKEPPPISEEKE